MLTTGVASFAGELGVVGAQLRVLAQHNLKVHADRYLPLLLSVQSYMLHYSVSSVHCQSCSLRSANTMASCVLLALCTVHRYSAIVQAAAQERAATLKTSTTSTT
jgi:hypothetical protein